jgi:hypothetical protein
MQRKIALILLCLFLAVLCTISCTHPTKTITITADGNYPADVANILINKCATSGCHNAASYQNAAGLLLDTWDHLFRGSISGAEVVPYSTLYSPLLYYTNTDPSLGIVATDPGHLTTPLTHDEYMTLSNWIAKGAPDKNGIIAFADNAATRQKIYLTLQGCDLIAVIDAKSRQVMRYIPIGNTIDQAPHDVEISGDGMYAYVPFYGGKSVQKLNVQTDTVIGSIDLTSSAIGGIGHWSVLTLSPLDTAFIVSGWNGNGSVVAVNTSTMQRNPLLTVDALTGGTDIFPYPHGLAANATFDTFFSTLQSGIIRYAFSPTGGVNYHKNIPATGQPHQIEMTSDHSKYFVTCPDAASAATNEVRAYDAHTDSLLKVFTVGTAPQEMDISPSKDYLFVACMEDAANPQPNRRGSVYVIDYNTLTVVTTIYGDFFQPHDITVDEQDGLIFIPSRNADPSGPAPHHATSCNGRPGWYSVYDLNTLLPADNKRYDVPVDPYAISTRFK